MPKSGVILSMNPSDGIGVIEGEDNINYEFDLDKVGSIREKISKGTKVTFTDLYIEFAKTYFAYDLEIAE